MAAPVLPNMSPKLPLPIHPSSEIEVIWLAAGTPGGGLRVGPCHWNSSALVNPSLMTQLPTSRPYTLMAAMPQLGSLNSGEVGSESGGSGKTRGFPFGSHTTPWSALLSPKAANPATPPLLLMLVATADLRPVVSSHWMPCAGDHLNGRPPLSPETSSESFMPLTPWFKSAGISWIVAFATVAEVTARSIAPGAVRDLEGASLQAAMPPIVQTASTNGVMRTPKADTAHTLDVRDGGVECKSHAASIVGRQL